MPIIVTFRMGIHLFFYTFHGTWQAWAEMTSQNVHKIFKNVKIQEFCDYIWNHHHVWIRISAEMSGIGWEMWETLRECWETKRFFMESEPIAA